MIELICSAISGFFVGVVSVYLWHLSKRIDELKMELSMKKFENESDDLYD